MSFEKAIPIGRTSDLTIDLYEADGVTPADLVSGDVVRMKIGKKNRPLPYLDLSSATQTANGSSITFTPGSNVVTVRIAQGDTAALFEQTCTAEIDVVDVTEQTPPNAIKFADEGVIHLSATQAGNLGLNP